MISLASYDWPEIRAKYETGNYSMKNLANEYGFNASYGARKSRQDGWEKGKSKEIVQEEATKKVIDELSQDEADLRRENLRYVQILKEKSLKEVLEEQPDFNRMKTFKIATEIIENIKGLEWDLLKISDKIEGEESDSLRLLAEKLEEARKRDK